MPKYGYTALDAGNNRQSGTVEARDSDDLRKILWARNLVLLKFKAVDDTGGDYRLKANEAAEFSRQLASMLGSGITLVRAMEILKDRDFKPRLSQVYQKLHRDSQQGYTMSEAMRLQPNAFPELLVNMYASGEASGQLENVASKMAVHYEKEHRLNSKVRTAMIYPIFLIVAMISVVMVIFIKVLPTFFELFEGIDLPRITKVVMSISDYLQNYWYLIIIGIFLFGLVSRAILQIHAISLKFDIFKLRIPIAGKLLKTIYTARFARTLSSLYSSGISMLSALEITATIIANKYIESQFSEVVKNVRNGEPLSVSVGGVDGFDKKLSTTILIGEESGRLDSMLESTAESFDYEAEVAAGRLVQLIGPIAIVLIAVVVCFVMLSVLLPIYTLYQNVGSM